MNAIDRFFYHVKESYEAINPHASFIFVEEESPALRDGKPVMPWLYRRVGATIKQHNKHKPLFDMQGRMMRVQSVIVCPYCPDLHLDLGAVQFQE